MARHSYSKNKLKEAITKFKEHYKWPDNKRIKNIKTILLDEYAESELNDDIVKAMYLAYQDVKRTLTGLSIVDLNNSNRKIVTKFLTRAYNTITTIIYDCRNFNHVTEAMIKIHLRDLSAPITNYSYYTRLNNLSEDELFRFVTFGHKQKLVNMTIKYLVAEGKIKFSTKFHAPVDNQVIKAVSLFVTVPQLYRSSTTNMPIENYLVIQNLIKNTLGFAPLYFDFMIWRGKE